MDVLKTGKPTLLGGLSGAIAGLVAITPAAGFVTIPAAIVIGFMASIFHTMQYPQLKTASVTTMP